MNVIIVIVESIWFPLMSTNAVLCLTDGKQTIRLTKYRCKPTLQVIDVLSNYGFEQETEFTSAFKATDMPAEKLMMNWAWLLCLESMSRKYWGVIMPTESIEETVGQATETPLEHLQWCEPRERS